MSGPTIVWAYVVVRVVGGGGVVNQPVDNVGVAADRRVCDRGCGCGPFRVQFVGFGSAYAVGAAAVGVAALRDGGPVLFVVQILCICRNCFAAVLAAVQ